MYAYCSKLLEDLINLSTVLIDNTMLIFAEGQTIYYKKPLSQRKEVIVNDINCYDRFTLSSLKVSNTINC